LGLPVEILLTPGQRADVTQAEALVKDHRPEAVLADKAFDSDAFIEVLRAKGVQVVIPPKANRLEQRAFDRDLYKERNLVERFMNRIKQFRRVATRYDKKAQNFLAFVQVAAILVLLA
jgi:putative transposase